MARNLGYLVMWNRRVTANATSPQGAMKRFFKTAESANKAAERAASKPSNAGKSFWVEGATSEDWEKSGKEIPVEREKNPAAVALGKMTSPIKKLSSAANGRKSKGRPRKNAR